MPINLTCFTALAIGINAEAEPTPTLLTEEVVVQPAKGNIGTPAKKVITLLRVADVFKIPLAAS